MRIHAGATLLALALGVAATAQTRAEPATPEIPKVKLMKLETTGLGG
jgi:hypothetical protein